MRTTLTIDDDVAIALERVRERNALTLEGVVNEALRRGLRAMDAEAEAGAGSRTSYRIRPRALGQARVDVANVQEALDSAERPDRR